MCIVCIANNINRNVHMYVYTRIFPTTGNARVLLFMFIRRELGGTGTECLFEFTYCEFKRSAECIWCHVNIMNLTAVAQWKSV